MEEALRALLAGYAPLTALVGANNGPHPGAGPSIYWSAIPQGANDPAVVLYLISGAPTYHMQGASALEGKRVQIDVRATSQSSVWAISRAIKDRLSGFKGSEGDIDFGGIFLDSERQGSEQPKNTLYFTVSMDFLVWSKAA